MDEEQEHIVQLTHQLKAAVASQQHPDDLMEFKISQSQNITECVPVPSSRHVAEIIGRQGCRIKALRTKTNTYIKTPTRGEEPVFVITGRRDDVALAKYDILSAAEYFSQIRSFPKSGSSENESNEEVPTCDPTPVPTPVTIQVRVPEGVVGLVVGPKGATIRDIQHRTHTYILTPSRDKDPVFKITGLPDNVQMAKTEIAIYTAIRTGRMPQGDLGACIGVNGDSELTASETESELLASIDKNKRQGLEGLGRDLELGASRSLSSVSGLGTLDLTGSGNVVGSSRPSYVAENWHSPSSPNRFSWGNTLTENTCGNELCNSLSRTRISSNGGMSNNGGFNSMHENTNTNNSYANPFNHHHISREGFGYYLFDSKWANTAATPSNGATQRGSSLMNVRSHHNGGIGGFTASGSEYSYLFGQIWSNSIDGGTLADPAMVPSTNTSFGSSIWGSFDRDKRFGDYWTLW